MNQRRAGFARGQHVNHRRQFVEFDRDGTGDVLGLAAAFGHAHGDDLADEAELVGGKDWLGRTFEAL